MKELAQVQEPIPQVKVEDYLDKMTAERKAAPDTTPENPSEPIESAAPELPTVKEAIDPLKAKSKTQRLLKFRDYVQKLLFGYLSGDMSLQPTFGLQQWEFDMLEDIYNEQLAAIGHVPKWLDILITEVMILLPRALKALDNRKLKAENERLAAKIAEMERNQASHFNAPEPLASDFRTDAKKWWELDANGYFMYDKSGYLKAEDKKHRPDITDPHQYEMAIKYNGKDKIHRIFNLNIPDG